MAHELIKPTTLQSTTNNATINNTTKNHTLVKPTINTTTQSIKPASDTVATPIFKTPEEALAYANQNNIKVAGSTNVAPTIASTSVQPKTVSISSQIKNVQPEEKTSFFDRLKNAGLSNEQNDKLNEQINDLDNPILNGMKRNQEFNKKANAVEKGSAKSFGANSIDAIVDTGQYVKNAFKSEMKKEQREDLELAQKLQNGFRGTRNQMTDEQANEFINYVKNKYNVTDFAKALNDVNEWTYQENELEKATNNMVSNINEENSKLGKVGQRITSAFGSVGRMTPTIAANIALPGSGMPVMFANSAQSAQDEALRNGATYDQAVFNGMLSGALEVGTEAIGGERIGKLTGIPTLTNKFGISTGIFGEIASEEIEEMISTTVQPLIDRITYNPNAPLATKEDYWNTFVDTALSTGVLIGIGDVVNYRNRAIEQVENSNMTQEQKQQSILEIEKGANEIINQIQEPNLQNSTQNNTNLANLDTNNMQISQNNVQTTEQSLGMQQIKKVELPSEIQTFVDNRNKISPGLSVELDNTLNTDGVIIKNSDGTRTMKINPNSTRAYEFVAIHEMLHDLEGTQEYQELSNFVKERATTQEGFEEAKKAITEQYTKYYQENGLDISGLNMDVETTNDMTAQALGNQDFLNELAGNKPNVFMRMYNWIKNVLFDGQNTGKTFAERRAQNKYLQELKSKFEVAYNTAYKGNTIQNYSIGYDIDNHPFIVIDEDILQNIPEDKWIKVVKETLKNKFPNGIDMDFFNIGINAKSRNEYVNSEYTKDIKKNETEKYKDKLRMANNIDEIVRNAYNVRNESLKHKRKDSFGSFNRSNIDVKIGNNDYTIDIVTGINKNNDEILYDIVNIKKKTSPIRFSTNVGSKNGTSSNNSIPSNNGAVNSQYMQNSSNNTQGLENSSSFSFNTIRNDIANADLNAEAKPHGLYVSNLFETDKNTFTYPFKDGELNTTYEIKVTPRNPLEVENFYMKTSRANDEILVDVGVSALKKLVANEEFDRINTLNKEQLIKELENKYPGYDYTKYYDKLELLAAYGAQLARAKGYDAIVAKKSTNSIKEIQDIENEISILKNDIMSVKNNNAENSNKSSFSLPKNSNLKELQLAIIEKYNPMRDDYHTGIRSVDDIKTFDEVINDDESFVWGDFSQEDAKKALEKGKIIVYSSKPIVQGGFVSTSKNQARDYAANGKIYSKEVNLNDVAWINGDEGQYAKVDAISFSQSNDKWQSYLDKNWDLMPNSKKTFGFPTNEQLNEMDRKNMEEDIDKFNLKKKKTTKLENIAGQEINNQKNSTEGSLLLQTIQQLRARDLKQGEEISNTLNMKKNNSKNPNFMLVNEKDSYKRNMFNNNAKAINDLIKAKNNSIKEIENKIIAKQNELNNKKDKTTKIAQNIQRQIINLEKRKADIEQEYINKIDRLESKNTNINKLKKQVSENRIPTRKEIKEKITIEKDLDNYNFDDIKEISKFNMNNTTPERVMEKIFNRETASKLNEEFIKPIKHNEAERIRFMNTERQEIENLGIKPKSLESSAVQKYGEGVVVDETTGEETPYTLKDLQSEFPNDWEKIKNASEVTRNKYDTYLDAINQVLNENGYDSIPKLKNYFRHFEAINSLFDKIGIPTKENLLPTDLNGLTMDLKPGKNFFANALSRTGKKTTYDAITGIDGYLEGASKMIYHTEDIQKLRALEDYLRKKYGSQTDLSNLQGEEFNARVEQIQNNHLSEFVAWLNEYTDNLAGKKSKLDRGLEEGVGRKIYGTLNFLKKQVGSNLTGFNLNSALSNFISVTQAGSKTSKIAMTQGIGDTFKNIFVNDGFINKSDFLTRRFGSDKLSKTWWENASNAGQIFMSGTDYFTANLITRSKYHEYLNKGYPEAEAMKKADEFADRLMGGRALGDMPNIFNSKTLGILTQFQLENVNQFDSMFHDTKYENRAEEQTKYEAKTWNEKIKSNLAKSNPKFYNGLTATFILGQLFTYAWLFNKVDEELTGSPGAFDIFGIIEKTIKDFTNPDIEKEQAIKNLLKNIIDQIPYANIVTGGGRVPMTDALPNIDKLLRGESGWEEIAWQALNLILPTGAGQIRKTYQGAEALIKGGDYTKDGRLKFPIAQEGSIEQKIVEGAQALLFGKWATQGGQKYIENGFKALSSVQTEGLEKAKELDISIKEFYDIMEKIKDIEVPTRKNEEGKDEAIPGAKKELIINELNKTDLNNEQKKLMYDIFYKQKVK